MSQNFWQGFYVKTGRPVYLNLLQIRLPIPGLVSILHRISGIVIFLGLPFLLYLLHRSLKSQSDFDSLTQFLTHTEIKFVLWIILAAITWHLLAGIRHLLMDIGIGESLRAARITAMTVLILAVIIILLKELPYGRKIVAYRLT